MTMEHLCDLMFDANVRFEGIWPFPVYNPPESLADALGVHSALPEELQSLAASYDEDQRGHLFEGLSPDFLEAYEELCCNAFNRRMFGFIAVAATPVLTPTGHGSASFSWGHYHTTILFNETIDGLLETASQWADRISDADMGRTPKMGDAA
ncbi:hypothetical protein [Novosphingobium pituita]|uniref:Uncharacterized protein n=1 Tax=Novosphingobium pituita TaxID=3056842 RepID=A0ABQ6PAP1_9SPHN|nr:hypothetical protein [Novosphingobium sp. IK01]GMM62316.1 hypothetical protein NUTIK01_30930 [Novosphingobium sp. IK01]